MYTLSNDTTVKPAVNDKTYGGGKFADGKDSEAYDYLLGEGTGQKNNRLKNSPEQLEMLASGDIQGYYNSRLAAGDAYAELALDVINNEGVLGKTANAWLFTQVVALPKTAQQTLLGEGTYMNFIKPIGSDSIDI